MLETQELWLEGSEVLEALRWLQWLSLWMRKTFVVGLVMKHETELADRRGRCVVGEDLSFLGHVSGGNLWESLN